MARNTIQATDQATDPAAVGAAVRTAGRNAPRGHGNRRRAAWLTRSVLVASLAAGAALGGVASARATGEAARQPDKVLYDWNVVAHRGGTEQKPESTLAAFRHTIDRGSDGIEFDVRFTKDKIGVIFHDDSLDRMTNCTGTVEERTLAKLKKCDIEFEGERFGEQKVPTLYSALNHITKRSSDLEFYVHVRHVTKGQAKFIVDKLKKFGLNKRSRTTLIGSNTTDLRKMDEAGAKKLGYVFGSMGGWTSDYDVLIPHNVEITADLIRAAQRRGQEVLPVETKPLSLLELVTLPVDGILANNLDSVMMEIGRLARPEQESTS